MAKLCVLPLLAALLLVGSCPSHPRHVPSGNMDLAAIRDFKRATDAYGRGEFLVAADAYHKGYESAITSAAGDSALKCLNNEAGAELAAYQYTAALKSFLAARQLAERLNNSSMEAVIWLNLSSLYLTLGNDSAAEQSALRASKLMRGLPKFLYRAEVLAQLGSFRIHHGDYEAGISLFREAINLAADLGKESLRAALNAQAGWSLFDRGQYSAAEPYINEAFRLRLQTHDRDLRSSYISASRLKLAQGSLALAAALIDRASVLPGRQVGPALWVEDYQRGAVRMAQNNVREARKAFAQALDAADAWHTGAEFSDESRVASDIGTHELTQSFVDACVRSGQNYFAQAFLAAERDRAAGLRQATQALRRSAGMTVEFNRTLGSLRQAQTDLLTANSTQHRDRVEGIRAELNELEARNYLIHRAHTNITERTSSSNTLRNIQSRLTPGEGLISFYRGTKDTYLWAVTDRRFEFHRLAAPAVLADLAARVAAAVQANTPNRETLSARLYESLFGQLSQEMQRQNRWVVTADDALFRIPFPALIAARSQGRPVYLVELHSLERIPSAWMLSRGGAKIPPGIFLGVGDGIYNRADPRWKGAHKRGVPLQLARLAASGQEVEACGRQWSGRSPALILIGVKASREAVQVAARERPAVLHFAAHFLYPEERRDEAVIDLGLNRRGQAELLTREDVANLDVSGSLVVMSGCSSASAGAVAGAGILGLSRAWLMAGASAVVGSLWPTPDDSGQLFQRFYAHLHAGLENELTVRTAADALRSAQIEMLNSASWRSEPRYWSAFYLMGKD